MIGSPAGGRRPFILRCFTTEAQPRDRCPSHARPNSRKIFNRTYQAGYTVTRTICGVDVSSLALAARIGRDGAEASFANTAQGILELGDFCRAHRVDLVAMEATGGYEQQPLALLAEQGLAAAILNPRAVRQFAEGMGRTEKTDAIDAGVIAWFAEVRRSAPTVLASPTQQRLRALVTRLRQLTQVRTAQRNQRRPIADAAVLASIDELPALLARQMRTLETAIAEIIVASVAGRYEPDFIAFRQRLAAAGKPPKVVRIALAHKLPVRLNAKARDVRRQVVHWRLPALLPATA